MSMPKWKKEQRARARQRRHAEKRKHVKSREGTGMRVFWDDNNRGTIRKLTKAEMRELQQKTGMTRTMRFRNAVARTFNKVMSRIGRLFSRKG